jgi:hypothetical protein
MQVPRGVRESGENEFHGDGSKLEDAIHDAHEKAKGAGHRAYRVTEIYAWGENPISGYRVIVAPVG